jgi:hypothetical protein
MSPSLLATPRPRIGLTINHQGLDDRLALQSSKDVISFPTKFFQDPVQDLASRAQVIKAGIARHKAHKQKLKDSKKGKRAKATSHGMESFFMRPYIFHFLLIRTKRPGGIKITLLPTTTIL